MSEYVTSPYVTSPVTPASAPAIKLYDKQSLAADLAVKRAELALAEAVKVAAHLSLVAVEARLRDTAAEEAADRKVFYDAQAKAHANACDLAHVQEKNVRVVDGNVVNGNVGTNVPANGITNVPAVHPSLSTTEFSEK